jgi:Protein of unknown function (DUF2899).
MLSWELIQDIVWDALLDTLKLLPFLFFAYLLMEAAEHRFSEKMEARLKSMGGLGPLVGAILGCVPQCGFSSAASNLYAAGLVSRGTLLAVFLSTSDEALPLMIGSPQGRRMIPLLLLSKVAIGIAAGFAVDLVLKKTARSASCTISVKTAAARRRAASSAPRSGTRAISCSLFWGSICCSTGPSSFWGRSASPLSCSTGRLFSPLLPRWWV